MINSELKLMSENNSSEFVTQQMDSQPENSVTAVLPPPTEKFGTEINEVISFIEQVPAEMIKIGPDFICNTSKGNQHCVSLVIISYPTNEPAFKESEAPENGEYQHTYYLIYTKDPSGKINGYKECHIDDPRGDKRMVTGGFVNVRDKGLGLSSVIEMANQAYLQQTANANGREVLMVTNNGNSRRIEKRIAEAEAVGDPNLVLQTIAETDVEKLRWESIYGAGAQARLGLDQDGKKRFIADPQNTNQIPDNSIVILERTGESLIPQISSVVNRTQSEEIPTEKTQRLLELKAAC